MLAVVSNAVVTMVISASVSFATLFKSLALLVSCAMISRMSSIVVSEVSLARLTTCKYVVIHETTLLIKQNLNNSVRHEDLCFLMVGLIIFQQ